jgi:hypothetical protein
MVLKNEEKGNHITTAAKLFLFLAGKGQLVKSYFAFLLRTASPMRTIALFISPWPKNCRAMTEVWERFYGRNSAKNFPCIFKMGLFYWDTASFA